MKNNEALEKDLMKAFGVHDWVHYFTNSKTRVSPGKECDIVCRFCRRMMCIGSVKAKIAVTGEPTGFADVDGPCRRP